MDVSQHCHKTAVKQNLLQANFPVACLPLAWPDGIYGIIRVEG